VASAYHLREQKGIIYAHLVTAEAFNAYGVLARSESTLAPMHTLNQAYRAAFQERKLVNLFSAPAALIACNQTR